MSSLALLFALILWHVEAGRPGTARLEVRGPDDLELVTTAPTLGEGCAVKVAPGLFRFACPLPHDTPLTFARPGWEPRTIQATQGVVDLHDGAWVAAPWPVRLSPLELAAGARLVWLTEEGVARATPTDGGQVSGPRVIPGTVGVLAVVGPNTAGTFIKARRTPDGVPLSVPLRPGRSLAVVCLEPWTWSVVPTCQVAVGKPSSVLRRFGLAGLRGKAHVEGEGGLFLVGDYEEEELVLAQAEELPPALGRLDDNDGVVEVVFPHPHRLRVALSDGKTGTPVTEGTIRIVALPHELLLAETKTDARGRVELAQGRGRVRVVAEARGYRRGEAELDIDQPLERVELALEAATVLRGQVWDEDGQPVGGAVVMAAGQDLHMDGTENVAATGGDGSFEVTAPGAGPWWVWAQAEEATSTKVLIRSAEERLSLRLLRECRVAILPTDSAGNVYPGKRLAFTGLDRAAIRLPEEVEPSGALRVRLSPGRWRAWAEEHKLSGQFAVPSPCEGVLLPVILTPPPGQP